jgi:hypothetical protein
MKWDRKSSDNQKNSLECWKKNGIWLKIKRIGILSWGEKWRNCYENQFKGQTKRMIELMGITEQFWENKALRNDVWHTYYSYSSMNQVRRIDWWQSWLKSTFETHKYSWIHAKTWKPSRVCRCHKQTTFKRR